jgi:hypothetical protein
MPSTGKRTIQKRHDKMCAQLYCNLCKEIRVEFNDEHWYDHVPKSVETRHEGKVTITELFLKINRASVIIKT